MEGNIHKMNQSCEGRSAGMGAGRERASEAGRTDLLQRAGRAVHTGKSIPRDDRVVFSRADLIDGTGAAGRTVDIEIAAGRIQSIGTPGTLRGDHLVDCAAKVLCPGFVDIHSHADFTLLKDGRAHSAILQGITTVVPGNCGIGIAPVSERNRGLAAMNSIGWRADREPGALWRTFGDYLSALRAQRPAVNIFPLVAHGAIRVAVSGFEGRSLNAREIDDVCSHVDEAMAAGAVGISTGLEYLPGSASTRQELRRVTQRVGAHQGLYATHCRNRAEHIVEAAREAVETAEHGGCRLQLSHFVQRPHGPYSEQAERAREAVLGADPALNAHFDVFPFDYGPTPLTSLLPAWARIGGREEIANQLASATVRRRVLDDLNPRFVAMLKSGAADGMYLSSDGHDGALVGRTLRSVAEEWGLNVADTALQVLVRAGPDLGDVVVVERWAEWGDLAAAMADDRYIVMGDGVVAALDGPVRDLSFSLSDWGYVPEMLGRMVRELGLTTLEEAVRRMTQAPAQQIGLTDRGVIAEGQAADLVVFDRATIASRVRPDHIVDVPVGIEHVMVNGQFALLDGMLTDARSGVVDRS
jgi:N-acyl-D-amino-acid deacylase